MKKITTLALGLVFALSFLSADARAETLLIDLQRERARGAPGPAHVALSADPAAHQPHAGVGGLVLRGPRGGLRRHGAGHRSGASRGEPAALGAGLPFEGRLRDVLQGQRIREQGGLGALEGKDPLDPMDSNQFVEQLVSFTEVEQSIETNQSLEELIALQSSNQAVRGRLPEASQAMPKSGSRKSVL